MFILPTPCKNRRNLNIIVCISKLEKQIKNLFSTKKKPLDFLPGMRVCRGGGQSNPCYKLSPRSIQPSHNQLFLPPICYLILVCILPPPYRKFVNKICVINNLCVTFGQFACFRFYFIYFSTKFNKICNFTQSMIHISSDLCYR